MTDTNFTNSHEMIQQHGSTVYAVRDNSCNWCRYGFAPTICYETMTELTQQRIKRLKTRLKD
jgi:hypothetical protein